MRRRTAILLAWLLIAPVLLLVTQPVDVAADGLTNRSLSIGTSAPGVPTTYDFTFDITFNTPLGSIHFEFCANSPIINDVCVQPAGFDISGAALDNQTGETGFSIAPGGTANTLLLTRTPTVATPQTVTFEFSGVVNPSTPNTTNYVRLQTYATDDGSGPPTEFNGIAFSINEDFSVTAFVPPYLQFCVGLIIENNDCSTATGDLIDLGILSANQTSVATSQMTGATNAAEGYVISVVGTTMTSGINTIPELVTPGISLPGTGQFGLNLRDNNSPDAGAEPVGPGTAVPVGSYDITNNFTFNNGDAVATSALPTDFNTLTATYIINIVPDQTPGIYTSTISYVAMAAF